MSIPLEGLRTVIYPAPDLDSAKQWWTALLGVEPYFDQPFYVGFSVAGYELGLLPDANPADGALVYWGVWRSHRQSQGESGNALTRVSRQPGAVRPPVRDPCGVFPETTERIAGSG
jgi:catechol 2,3-dioxygenase-like lactoylglutathione lyase family enzyme